MVEVCPSARGRGEGGSKGEGKSSRAMAMKSRQHAAAVEHVIRPICPRTALIFFLEQLAISGRSASIAAESHCPAQRRAMRSGWLGIVRRVWNLRSKASIGPGGPGNPPNAHSWCSGSCREHGLGTRTYDRSGKHLPVGPESVLQ